MRRQAGRHLARSDARRTARSVLVHRTARPPASGSSIHVSIRAASRPLDLAEGRAPGPAPASVRGRRSARRALLERLHGPRHRGERRRRPNVIPVEVAKLAREDPLRAPRCRSASAGSWRGRRPERVSFRVEARKPKVTCTVAHVAAGGGEQGAASTTDLAYGIEYTGVEQACASASRSGSSEPAQAGAELRRRKRSDDRGRGGRGADRRRGPSNWAARCSARSPSSSASTRSSTP